MPTTVRRARLGNATEDISYIGNGRVAVLDGYDLLLVPSAQTTDPRVRTRKLFDVRKLAITDAPRGVAYLATEGLYAFNDLRRRSTILLAGASFAPASSLTRTESGFLVGSDNVVALLDAAGNVILSREIPEALSVEGVAQTEAGAIVAADIFAGRLFFFDRKLNRTPEMDRDYRIGPGVASPTGLAWDALFGRHLVLGLAPEDGPTAQQVTAVEPSLDSAARAVDLTAQGFTRGRRMTYIPEENLTAVAHQTSPRAILLFDKEGNLAETLDVSAVGSPTAIAYVPSRREFAVRVTGSANAKTLFIFSRDGKLSRTVDLSATGITSVVALTHFGAASGGEGRLLVLDAPLADADPVTNRAVITTLDGSLVGDFNTRKSLGVLNPGDVAEITSGPEAGSLSIIDRSSNELVVFSMDAGTV
jgi:hypothetical protein